MTANAPGPEGLASDLEGLLGRELGAGERAPRHAMLRLQPTVLPPPPGEDGYTGASHEDDIDLGLDDDGEAARRQLALAAVGVSIAVAGVAGWLLFGRPTGEPERPPAVPPVVLAPPPAATPAPPPVAPPAPAIAAPAPTTAGGDAAMGPLSTELIAPSTEGLSPARKVNAVRIVVEGDQEVR